MREFKLHPTCIERYGLMGTTVMGLMGGFATARKLERELSRSERSERGLRMNLARSREALMACQEKRIATRRRLGWLKKNRKRS